MRLIIPFASWDEDMHRQTGLERMLLHARGHTPIVCAADMHYDRRSAQNVSAECVKYRHHVLRKHHNCKFWTFLHLYHHFCIDMHSSVCYSKITKEKEGDSNEVSSSFHIAASSSLT